MINDDGRPSGRMPRRSARSRIGATGGATSDDGGLTIGDGSIADAGMAEVRRREGGGNRGEEDREVLEGGREEGRGDRGRGGHVRAHVLLHANDRSR